MPRQRAIHTRPTRIGSSSSINLDKLNHRKKTHCAYPIGADPDRPSSTSNVGVRRILQNEEKIDAYVTINGMRIKSKGLFDEGANKH